MLGQEIEAVLPELRAQAESLMVDTCRITADGEGEGDWNDANGTYDQPERVTVYEGKCRLRRPSAAPRDADSGEALWSVDDYVLSLPVEGSEDVADGHAVEMVSSSLDAAVVGLELTVAGGHWQSHSTARRVPCKVVTRDA